MEISAVSPNPDVFISRLPHSWISKQSGSMRFVLRTLATRLGIGTPLSCRYARGFDLLDGLRTAASWSLKVDFGNLILHGVSGNMKQLTTRHDARHKPALICGQLEILRNSPRAFSHLRLSRKRVGCKKQFFDLLLFHWSYTYASLPCSED